MNPLRPPQRDLGPTDCHCLDRASWFCRGFYRGTFVYQGQIRSVCGLTQRWVCTHDHKDRHSAKACADRELERWQSGSRPNLPIWVADLPVRS